MSRDLAAMFNILDLQVLKSDGISLHSFKLNWDYIVSGMVVVVPEEHLEYMLRDAL